MMKKCSVVFQTIRVPFLFLTPVCVFLGVSIALYNQATFDIFSLVLALIGALFAHISVNTLNEYLDFKSGLDLNTLKTPFSGGSGALPANPDSSQSVLMVGMLSLLITVFVGSYFIFKFGTGLLPIGVLGVLIIVSYTNIINKNPYLCLIAPGFGFSLVVIGTQYVLIGKYLPITFIITLIPFFLINNLLLLNQYPDIEADKKAGRYHFPIAFGVNKSTLMYTVFHLLSMITILLLTYLKQLPTLSLISLLPSALAFFTLSGANKHGADIGSHPKYLAANVIVTLLIPTLLGITLLV